MTISPERVFPKVIAVDEQDREIGVYDLMETLAKGLIRRVSLVYIFNESGHLLLQKRADWVLSPNLYSQSAAGHVNEGSDYHQTAIEELREELGLGVKLKEVGLSLPSPGLFNGIFKGVIADDSAIDFDSDEVGSVRWISIDELEREMATSPELYTDSFIQAWQLYRDKILST